MNFSEIAIKLEISIQGEMTVLSSLRQGFIRSGLYTLWYECYALLLRWARTRQFALSDLKPIFSALFRVLRVNTRRVLRLCTWLLAPSVLSELIYRHSLALILCYSLLSLRVYLRKSSKTAYQWVRRSVGNSLGTSHFKRIQTLKEKMDKSRDYESWKEAANEIDILEGKISWKENPESPLYDHVKIQTRLRSLRELVDSEDTEQVLRYLRSRLVRNIGGIGSTGLHTYMYAGTKTLIEEYIAEVERALLLVLHDTQIPSQRKLAFFNETRHAFGRSALMLSGGGQLGLYHAGVIKALVRRSLIPRILSGSSVGSILAGFVATRTDTELEKLFVPGAVQLAFFPPHKGSWMRKLKRLISEGVLMDIGVLEECVRNNIGDFTFSEAYARTGRVLNIVVAPGSGSKETPMLLNHLTSPDVLVWSASLASCAIPGIYAPVELMAKDCSGEIVPYYSEGMKWQDGSVVSDLPTERLAELFNVNHFIVSQVNPHVLPFVFPTLLTRNHSSFLYTMVHFFGVEIKQILLNIYNVSSELIPFTKLIWNLLNQKYTGHITLFPQTKLWEFGQILTNPSQDRLMQCIDDAEKYTFRHIALIENHCKIETVLEECVRKVRATMILSKELPFKEDEGSPSALLTSRTRSWSTDQFTQMQRTLSSIERDVASTRREVRDGVHSQSLPNVNSFVEDNVEDLSDSDVVPFI